MLLRRTLSDINTLEKHKDVKFQALITLTTQTENYKDLLANPERQKDNTQTLRENDIFKDSFRLSDFNDAQTTALKTALESYLLKICPLEATLALFFESSTKALNLLSRTEQCLPAINLEQTFAQALQAYLKHQENPSPELKNQLRENIKKVTLFKPEQQERLLKSLDDKTSSLRQSTLYQLPTDSLTGKESGTPKKPNNPGPRKA